MTSIAAQCALERDTSRETLIILQYTITCAGDAVKRPWQGLHCRCLSCRLLSAVAMRPLFNHIYLVFKERYNYFMSVYIPPVHFKHRIILWSLLRGLHFMRFSAIQNWTRITASIYELPLALLFVTFSTFLSSSLRSLLLFIPLYLCSLFHSLYICIHIYIYFCTGTFNVHIILNTKFPIYSWNLTGSEDLIISFSSLFLKSHLPTNTTVELKIT